jgi:glutathione S-transferase
MKLYYTRVSPYARLVRIVVIDKGLAGRVELLEAATRTPNSPYYRVNASGRVPYLVRDDGAAMEDSQLICLYLDQLGTGAKLCVPFAQDDWAYGRLECYARSMLDGLSVHLRELRRPEDERSPTILVHETDRAVRLADFWEAEVAHPLLNGPLNIAQLLLVIALDVAKSTKMAELEGARPKLAAWASRMRERPSVKATAPG